MHRSHTYRRRERARPPEPRRFTPAADPRLKRVFARIGVPESEPFTPDRFQLEALAAVEHGDCLVTAPTGSGKTWIAEQAIARVRAQGGSAWYACPLKALSNAKHAEFSAIFGAGEVGILTGDRKENPDAPVTVGTTEILRNQLYDAMHRGESLDTDLVVLDEAHYLGDRERGVVWEEVMIYLPARVRLLLLSATIGNAGEIAAWLASIRGRACTVVAETKRPVPIFPLFLDPGGTLIPLAAPARKGAAGGLDQRVADGLGQKRGFARAAPPCRTSAASWRCCAAMTCCRRSSSSNPAPTATAPWTCAGTTGSPTRTAGCGSRPESRPSPGRARAWPGTGSSGTWSIWRWAPTTAGSCPSGNSRWSG